MNFSCIVNKFFLLSKSSRPAMGPTHPLIKWIPGVLSWGKVARAKGKNECSYTSASSVCFMARRGTTFSHIQTILVDTVMQHMLTAWFLEHTRIAHMLMVLFGIRAYIYRVSQEERARLREHVPYVKVYRYNPKHLYPKLNGYGDNSQLKMGASCGSKYWNLHSWYVTWQC